MCVWYITVGSTEQFVSKELIGIEGSFPKHQQQAEYNWEALKNHYGAHQLAGDVNRLFTILTGKKLIFIV